MSEVKGPAPEEWGEESAGAFVSDEHVKESGAFLHPWFLPENAPETRSHYGYSIKETEPETVPEDRIEVGKSYDVVFSDCCVEGSFTAKVEDLVYRYEWSERPVEVGFDNGVVLTETLGVTFVLVEEGC